MGTDSKVTDIKGALKKARQKKGWTQAEIEEAAARELEQFGKHAENEPEHLVSGDMKSIIEGKGDEERD